MKIRVIDATGIGKEWLGIELEVLPPEEAKKVARHFDPMTSSGEGYIVSGPDALVALVKAGKAEAAAGLCHPEPPSHLEFPRNCCEVI